MHVESLHGGGRARASARVEERFGGERERDRGGERESNRGEEMREKEKRRKREEGEGAKERPVCSSLSLSVGTREERSERENEGARDR